MKIDVAFSEVPAIYGPVHLIILAVIVIGSVISFFLLRKMRDRSLLVLLSALGFLMIAAEIFKQWFVSRYVYPDFPSAWFFPWQFCSMAMYCSAVVLFLKGKAQDTVLVFLSSFSLLAALFALGWPGDMMRPQILLFVHSFAYHAIMIIESIAAMLILTRKKKVPFYPAVILFCCMAGIAEIVNIISHYTIGANGLESNMFNITPFYQPNMPVFSWIAQKVGVIPEILIYLAMIVLGSWLLYLAEYALLNNGKEPKKNDRTGSLE